MDVNNLLAVGDSNWNYILREYGDGSTAVIAVAKKDSGCSDSHFCNIKRFKYHYQEKNIGSLTALGEKIVFNL